MDSVNNAPIRWTDRYEITPSRVVYTNRELQIPGVRTFGHQLIYDTSLVLQPHYHESAYELLMIASGANCFSIDGQLYVPKDGDVFLVQPNTCHFTSDQHMSRGEIYWLQLESLPDMQRLFLNDEASLQMTNALTGIGNAVIRPGKDWQRRLIVNAFNLAQSSQYTQRYLIASLLSLFIESLIHRHSIGSASTPHISSDIDIALTYIKQHICEVITLEHLAMLSGLSLSQFKIKFRQQLHCTPRVYIYQSKIELAKELLLQNASATKTSQLLGFDTPAYFSTVFRKYASMTPSEYIITHIAAQ